MPFHLLKHYYDNVLGLNTNFVGVKISIGTQAFYINYASEILSVVMLESKCVKVPNEVFSPPLSLVLITAPEQNEGKEQSLPVLTGENVPFKFCLHIFEY